MLVLVKVIGRHSVCTQESQSGQDLVEIDCFLHDLIVLISYLLPYIGTTMVRVCQTCEGLRCWRGNVHAHVFD